MKTYILYLRRKAVIPEEFAWQIDLENRKNNRVVFDASSYKKPIPLEDFARETARIRRPKINWHDLLTTIPAPVFIPANEYVDEPVTGRQLAHFWRVYNLELDRLKS